MAPRPKKSAFQVKFKSVQKSFKNSAFNGNTGVKDKGIRSKIRTKVKDRGYKAIIEQMRILERDPYVKVGLPKESDKTAEAHIDEKGKATGTTVLQVGVAHEFGTEKLPERSWLRAAHDSMVPEMNAVIKKLYQAIMDGRMTVSRALSIVGLLAERNTKKFLTDDKVKPPSQKKDFSLVKFGKVNNANSKAPGTQTKRTSYKTLIDTAQLLNSITFIKIMNGKGKKK